MVFEERFQRGCINAVCVEQLRPDQEFARRRRAFKDENSLSEHIVQSMRANLLDLSFKDIASKLFQKRGDLNVESVVRIGDVSILSG